MAEIGLIASVVGVAGAALTSSRALFEMVDEVRNAPVELSAISKDIHSFHDVVSSVQMAIRDRLVIKALLGDKKLCELVVRLEAPLQNCSNALTQLKPRIQTHLKSTSDGKFRISSIDVRWIFKKKDIIECRNRLEVTKSTLDAALTSVIFFCSLRSAGQDVDSVRSSHASTISRDLDAGSVLREYAESIAPTSPPLDALSTIDRIELPAEMNSNPTELDAEAVGNPSSDLNSTPHSSPSGTFRIDLPAELDSNPVEIDSEAVGNRSSDLNSTPHRSSSETFSSHQEATNQYKGLVNSNETSEDSNFHSTIHKSLMPHSSAGRFYEAIKNHNLSLVKALLQDGYDVNHVPDSGMTALHMAIEWGREDIVAILLANNANVNTKNLNSNPRNMTPLHYAARYGYTCIVEILLDHGADIAARDRDGGTALGLSIGLDDDDTAIVLVRRASALIDMVTINHLPLQYAIHRNRPKVVEALIVRGKQLGQLEAMLDSRDDRDWTHLMVAIWKGSIQIVSQLLAVGANIEERNSDGWIPLLLAAYYGRIEMIDFLIAQGADRQARSNDGRDYLQILARNSRKKYEEYMRKVKS
ncbi:hypothetical protein G7Y79_00013g035910 [Physcia stellaris]|nr:hypothetical protein G7Y79_00013g035910 [Physcia stellaris]